jgi:hypothetical protein
MKMRWCAGLLLCLAWAGRVNADGDWGLPCLSWLHWSHWAVCPSVGCCPDDYVRKPFPRLYCVSHCGGPDDYCRKPFPPAPPLPCHGTPDDYCRKPFPTLLCPPHSPYLQCGPPDASCAACCKCAAVTCTSLSCALP